jgi:branched-chain amino acid aminotransferase
MSVVWLNGVLVDAGMARIDPADRGFTLGDGVFETIRAQDGVPLHAARHFARLRDGALVLGISVPIGDDTLFDALCGVLRANNFADAALRLTFSRGPAARGVLPVGGIAQTVLISAGTLPEAAAPARLIVAQRTRRNEFSPLSRIKSLNYLDSVLARQEAEAAGADDAVLLNTQGDMAEATAANIVLFMDGRWLTPRVVDGALPGIARGLLLDAGRVVEARIGVDDLARVEAGFLINSLGWRVVRAVGDLALNVHHLSAGVLMDI